MKTLLITCISLALMHDASALDALEPVRPGVTMSTRGSEKFVGCHEAKAGDVLDALSEASVFTVRLSDEASELLKEVKLTGVFSEKSWYGCLTLIVEHMNVTQVRLPKQLAVEKKREKGKIMVTIKVVTIVPGPPK
jgi:hypothetical protein